MLNISPKWRVRLWWLMGLLVAMDWVTPDMIGWVAGFLDEIGESLLVIWRLHAAYKARQENFSQSHQAESNKAIRFVIKGGKS